MGTTCGIQARLPTSASIKCNGPAQCFDGKGHRTVATRTHSRESSAQDVQKVALKEKLLDRHSFKQAADELRARCLLTSRQDYTVLISACGRHKSWAEAINAFFEMEIRGFAPDVICYTALISSLSQATQWQRALGVLSLLREAKAHFASSGILGQAPRANVFVYGACLSAAARGHQWQHALVLLGEMRATSVQPNNICFNSAISACEKSLRWQFALWLFSELQQDSLQPDLISYNAAMSSLEKGRQWQRALDLLNEMRSPMNLLQPDVITYNAAISAAEKGLQWESALCLLQEMLTKGPAPNIISFNAAISALEKAELWERALALLEDAATRAGISADLITYSAIISALGRGQQWQAAMGLLVQLRTSKLQPSLVTYNAAVSAAERASEWRIALQLLFAEIRPRGMEPDIITYNSAVSATSRVHRWQLAHSIFRSMRQRPGGPAPDHITYNAAIAASETGQQAELVLELLREMTSLSLSPGPSVRSRAVLACLGAGLWSQALEILDELLRKGLSGFGSGGTGGTVGLAEKVASLESFSEDENTASDASNFKGLPLRCAADKEFCASLQACVGPLLSACETRDFCKQELALLHLLAWRPALDEDNTLHEDSLDYDELLSLLAAAGRNAAASRLLARGRHKQAIALISYHKSHATVSDAASAAGVVTACLQAAAHGEAVTGYVAANPWRGRLVQSIPARRPYARELSMLRHVLARARPGDAAAVCEAIEHFGEKVMGSAGMWSKFAGGSKSACLVAASSGSMASSGGVLEIGTYCGYSAIKLASALSGSHITSLEVDPTMVVIARNLVALAGLALQVDVRTGHTQTMLPQLAAERPTVPHSFGVVFMDRWGSQYEEDRLLLERHRLLMPGAVIVADNILSTGAALFLWSCVTPVARPQFGLAGSLPAYHTQVLQVKEVGSGSGVEVCEDWMSVSVTRAFSDFKADPALNHSPTADVVELHAASERMRELAFGPGRSVTFKERAAFTAKMRKGLELLLAGRL